eukprot:1531529-Prorocentrum_lima.AAC.1
MTSAHFAPNLRGSVVLVKTSRPHDVLRLWNSSSSEFEGKVIRARLDRSPHTRRANGSLYRAAKAIEEI